MVIQETDYLAHYGVKGMRWGVRKEYEPKGRKKGSSTTVTSEKKQLTPEEKKARNKAIAKKVAIGAAVVAGSIGLYYSYKLNNVIKTGNKQEWDMLHEVDVSKLSSEGSMFSKGYTFQRVTAGSTEDMLSRGRTFVSYLQKDNEKYRAAMPTYFYQWWKSGIVKDTTPYIQTLKAKTDIRAPSAKEAYEIMRRMHPEYDTKFSFRQFMANLSNERSQETREFFSELKRLGYNAVPDLNDTGWTEKPLIILDPGEVLETVASKRYGRIERVIDIIKYKK